jgi:hypothetical protein
MQRAALQHATGGIATGSMQLTCRQDKMYQKFSMQRSALHHAKRQDSRCNNSKIGCSRMHCNMQRSALHHAEETRIQISDATDNKIWIQRTTLQHATGRADNMQRCNGQHCSMQRAALQRAETTRRNGNEACNGQHGTMRKRQDVIPDATDNKIGCNGKHGTMQQAEPTTCNVATWYFILQHAALLQPATCNTHNGQLCNGRHAIGSVATDGIATGSVATDDMQQTALQRTTCNRQRCNGQHCSSNEKRHCSGRHCNLRSSYHATDRLQHNTQTCNGPPWCRGTTRASRPRAHECAVRRLETARAIITPFSNGSAAQCRGF